jgi:integral membrane protein (TIGR01906 family)
MRALLIVLIVVSVPVFLATTNVRLLATTPAFYEWGFRRHQISEKLGFSAEQLRDVADQFIAYFRAAPGPMELRVEANGEQVPLFNEREIAHMVDVQSLMHTLGTVQVVSGIALLASLAVVSILDRRILGAGAGIGLIAGAAATFAILLLLGAATFVDFSSLWTRFHLVAFSNDLWMLDLERDNLIRLFPPPFWADATMLLAALTAVESVLVAVVGLTAWLGVWNRPAVAAATRSAWPGTLL